jgi:4-diphosphocytidyl-2-C-methyl-D-erythritol kinase
VLFEDDLLNKYLSPAKLNLTFRILHKRSDGYHEIASYYQAIDLCDRLFFTWADQDQFTCTDPSLVSSNLVTKALHLFRTHYPVPPIHIHLEKIIPIQAGLGGGSSNAATTLWALNELTGSPALLSQLRAIGAQLGSDVPFFFSSGSALCSGRGEIVQDCEPIPLQGWIAKPPYGLSTPLVYKEVRIGALPDRRERFYNDLEEAAFRLEPRLALFKQELQKHFQTVVMTGSGTAFFCLEGEPPSSLVSFPIRSISRGARWYTQCEIIA